MKKLFVLFGAAVLILSACTKYEEVIIDDNQAPPDSTLSEVLIQTYINKAYISVLGRKPNEDEKAEATAILEADDIAQDDREAFIDIVLGKDEYNEQLIKIASVDLLGSFDTAAISQQIAIFELLLQDITYQFAWETIQYEIDRLEEARTTLNDLENGTINPRGMHRRLIDNYFYDQINMGTENFVRATFENFLFRYPTESELDQAKTMVDGFNAIFFLENGNSKDDFMDIFFDSDDYYESRSRDLFNKYLFREPSSEEMVQGALLYKQSDDYKLLQKSILTMDEYVGID